MRVMHTSRGTGKTLAAGHPRLQALNDRLAASAVRHRFADAQVPFICECGADDCDQFVLLTLAEYSQLCERGHALLADSH